ncbi:MAG: hypothetical protein LBK63_06865 [Treponema sp.]|jgi:hypothetical protein|nr:hypothetical protein [Treponema sp.]
MSSTSSVNKVDTKAIEAAQKLARDAIEKFGEANDKATVDRAAADKQYTDAIDSTLGAFESTLNGIVDQFGIDMDTAQKLFAEESKKINLDAYNNIGDAINDMTSTVSNEAAKYSSKIINGWDEPVLDANGNPVLNPDGTPQVNHVNGIGENKAEIDAIIDSYATTMGADIATMVSSLGAANDKLATDAAQYMDNYQQKLDDMAANSATQSAAVQAAYKSAIDARESKVSGFVESFSNSTANINETAQKAIKSVVDKYVADTGEISSGLAKSLNDLNTSMAEKGEQITADLKTAIDQGNQALEAANAELGTAEQQVGKQAEMAAGQSAVIGEAAGQQAANTAQQAARQSGMAGQAAGLMGVTEGAKATREAFMGALENNRAAAQQAQQTRLQAQQTAAQSGMDQAQQLAALEEAQRSGDFSQTSSNLNTGAQAQLDTAKNAADMQTDQLRKDQQAELDRMRETLNQNVANANQSGADAVHAVDTQSSENQAEANRQATANNAFLQAQLEQGRAEQKAAFEKAMKEQEEKAKVETENKNSKISSIENAANTAMNVTKDVKDTKVQAAREAAQDTLQKEEGNAERLNADNKTLLDSQTDEAKTTLATDANAAGTIAAGQIGKAQIANSLAHQNIDQSLEEERMTVQNEQANTGVAANVGITNANNAQSAANQNAANSQALTNSIIGGSTNLATAAIGKIP